MVNLDTHVLVHALTGDLSPHEEHVLRREPWGVSAIVLWELAKLVQLGRLTLDLDSAAFRRALAALHIWPLDLDVARQSTRLDFKSDPADEWIAATSIVHAVPLLTRDERIRRSALVPLA